MTYDRFTAPRNDTTVTIGGVEYVPDTWMDLIEPKNCKVIASYNHKYYGDFAAVTESSYGLGQAVYVGCKLPREALQVIIKDISEKNDIDMSPWVFPVIVKKGINTLGENITYIYNYSSEEKLIEAPFDSATDLLTGAQYAKGDSITLKDWDLVILTDRK